MRISDLGAELSKTSVRPDHQANEPSDITNPASGFTHENIGQATQFEICFVRELLDPNKFATP